ncbi:MAG: hypothetical protein ACK57O_18005, partial [Planctomyces sp.]
PGQGPVGYTPGEMDCPPGGTGRWCLMSFGEVTLTRTVKADFKLRIRCACFPLPAPHLRNPLLARCLRHSLDSAPPSMIISCFLAT